jgi:hypothetical protein
MVAIAFEGERSRREKEESRDSFLGFTISLPLALCLPKTLSLSLPLSNLLALPLPEMFVGLCTSPTSLPMLSLANFRRTENGILS